MNNPTTIGAAELGILQHALGLDQYGHGRQYRNHFVTGVGSTDYPVCMRLVDAHLMTRAPGNDITGGDDVFRVTERGIDHVRTCSPTPPKLTRSQRRYRAFLAADSGLTFAQWIGAAR